MAKVVITGGTGMVGQRLANLLLSSGHQVTILTRRVPEKAASGTQIPYALWNPEQCWVEATAIHDADYIVHLAGANVAEKRWTAARKKEILDSRVQGAATIVQALRQIPNHVKAVISASAIGWYGPDSETSLIAGFHETDPADPSFLGETCRKWEEGIRPVEELGKRLVIFRIGIVLDTAGGALPAFLQSLRFRVAGNLGNGTQIISWIHQHDLCRMMAFAIENEELKGIYNAVSPHPVSNNQFNRLLAEHLYGRNYLAMPVPSLVLKALLGEMSVEVLKSATVASHKIRQAGFKFEYPSLVEAFRELLPDRKIQ
ncbi:MAG: TIGR01777 family oxidoreductase [Bacteroidota bacterium]|jgi:uncharacterized protein (TIGR01777 family)